MKIDLSGRTGRFARRTLSDFSEKMILLLTDMPLEEISVRKKKTCYPVAGRWK